MRKFLDRRQTVRRSTTDGASGGHGSAERRALAACSEARGLIDTGELHRAELLLREAVELKYDLAEAHQLLGGVFTREGRLEDALDCYYLAEHFDPASSAIQLELIDVLQRLGRLDEARTVCCCALERQPGCAALRVASGNVNKAQGDLKGAVAAYRRAVELDPTLAEVFCNLGLALYQLGSWGEARECYDQALALNPRLVEAIHNKGLLMLHEGEVEAALQCFRKALELRPESPEIRACEAHALRDLGRFEEALVRYDAVLRDNPEFGDAVLNRSLVYLLTGDFERGWKEYNRRFKAANRAARSFTFRHWHGEPLSGRTLLAWGEQGIGDEIKFASLIPELAERAGRCTVECAPKLVALFRESFPQVQVVARSDPPDPGIPSTVDYQVALGSAARWLRPGLASFPAEPAYLRAPPARVDYWRRRFAGLGEGIKVGFSWRSTNLKGERSLACTRIDQWGAIFGVPGVHFVCLQYDECGAELEEARRRFGVELHAFPEVDLFNDLAEAAALTAACDLVISAPTSVSMLAAALGVTTWQLAYGRDWDSHGTSHVPWFPSMRRFNRVSGQTWEKIMDDVARALAARAGAVTVDV